MGTYFPPLFVQHESHMYMYCVLYLPFMQDELGTCFPPFFYGMNHSYLFLPLYPRGINHMHMSPTFRSYKVNQAQTFPDSPRCSMIHVYRFFALHSYEANQAYVDSES